jgi:hypothetical protein
MIANIADCQKIIIPESIHFNSVLRISVPKPDPCSDKDLDWISQASPEILAEISEIWQLRDNLDLEKGQTFPVLSLNDKSLTNVIRWHLRGMTIDLAVRKVRSHMVLFLQQFCQQRIETKRKSKIIKGFRCGDRVEIKQPHKKLIDNAQGTVTHTNYETCSVLFDCLPAQGLQTFAFFLRYEALINLDRKPLAGPTLKLKRQAKLEPEGSIAPNAATRTTGRTARPSP